MISSKQKYQKFRDAGAKPADAAKKEADAKSPQGKTKRRRYFRDYIGWLWPFRFAILKILIIATATATLSLILPRATMYIVDNVLTMEDRSVALGKLHWIGLALILVITVQQSLDWLRHWSIAVLNARVLTRLRQRLYDHMLRLPLNELSELKTGGITSRLSGDVDSVTGVVQIAIITPTIATLKVVLTMIMLLWINWKMCVAAACLLPGIVVLNLMYIKKIRPIYRSMRQDRQDIDSRVVESFGGIRVVRAFAREFNEAKSYGVLHHTVIRKQLMARAREFVVWSGWGYLIPLCALVIIWFGGTLVLKDQATIGGIVAFQMYVMMLLSPMSTLVESFGQTQQALAAMERIFDVLNVKRDMPDREKALPAPREIASLEFDRVSFAYPTDAKLAEQNTLRHEQKAAQDAKPRPTDAERGSGTVLRDVSLRVPGGSTVALVGPSGSGKTTITNLVARFYDPTDGVVRVNGIDLRDIQLRSYRRLLGLVQQDTFLFDGTIAENIAYRHPDSPRETVIDAAKRANAHEFISSFADGYDTLIGERGVRLSGGQAQRVSIARAILADPRILILDEATSNLDSESEQLIQAALAELMQDRTTFVIAHRLSTITHADMIVVIEDGQISEMGTHAELMAADSRYREMVERQQRATLGEEPVAEWL